MLPCLSWYHFVYQRGYFQNRADGAFCAQLIEAEAADQGRMLTDPKRAYKDHHDIELGDLAEVPLAHPHNLHLFFSHLLLGVLVVAQCLNAKFHFQGFGFKQFAADEDRDESCQLKVPSVWVWSRWATSEQIDRGEVDIEVLYATDFATMKNPVDKPNPHTFAELDRELGRHFGHR